MPDGIPSTKMKKPIYKKWWFWILVVVLLAAIFGSGSGTENNDNDTSTSNNSSSEIQEESSTPSEDITSQSDAEEDNSNETVIPDVVGMSLQDADDALKDFNLTYIEADGSEANVWVKSNWRIDAIEPAAGTTTQKGSDVTLTLANTKDEEREARQAEQAAQEAEARANIEYTDVSAAQLVADLESNAMVAKETYVGGNYRISGVVSNIDASGKYISINPDDNPWNFTNIQCFVRYDDTTEAIRQLSTDQHVSVCGEITDVGEILGYAVDINRIEY